MDTAYQLQHWDENLTPQYLTAVIVTLVASIIGLFIRMVSQYMIDSLNAIDNYLILVATVRNTFALSVVYILMWSSSEK